MHQKFISSILKSPCDTSSRAILSKYLACVIGFELVKAPALKGLKHQHGATPYAVALRPLAYPGNTVRFEIIKVLG